MMIRPGVGVGMFKHHPRSHIGGGGGGEGGGGGGGRGGGRGGEG